MLIDCHLKLCYFKAKLFKNPRDFPHLYYTAMMLNLFRLFYQINFELILHKIWIS